MNIEAIEVQWCKALRSIAQRGLTYAHDFYDIERYQQLMDICDEMTAVLADKPLEAIKDLFAPDEGHPTPKVDLRAAVIQDDKILLVKESDNYWSLPGGWADVNEAPSKGVVREVKEETGLTVKVDRLFAVKDRSCHEYKPYYPFHIYKLFFLCKVVEGKLTPSHETSEVKFFDLEDLPNLSIDRVLPEDFDMIKKAGRNKSYLYWD